MSTLVAVRFATLTAKRKLCFISQRGPYRKLSVIDAAACHATSVSIRK